MTGKLRVDVPGVALANQPLIVAEFDGSGTDGLALISVDHTTVSTAAALGAGIRFKTGDGTTGSNTKPGYIFMQGAGNSDIKYIAPKAHAFYVDHHDDDLTGTTYNDYGTLSLTLNENGSATFAGATTFNDDITFTGDSANVFWDKSQNQLEFADNAKAIFGTGTDLQIYHNGQDSYIQDSGTGDIIIYGSGETLARFKDDGGVTLFHNDLPQFDTVGTGVSVINQISVGATATFDAKVITGTGATVGFGSTAYFKDNAKLSFGAAADLDIWHDGSHSYIKDTKSAGSLYLQSSNLLINNQANNATMIKAEAGSSVELYYAGTKPLETSTLGV